MPHISKSPSFETIKINLLDIQTDGVLNFKQYIVHYRALRARKLITKAMQQGEKKIR